MDREPETSQAPLVAAFTAGAVSGVGAPILRIDTHLSHVFVTKERAFKLKRAVRLPFVDFSTIERRRAACAAELAVNRRFATALYLAALPVTREADGFAIDGEGETVDWIVVMRRFAQEHQFDHLAATGMLTPALVRSTAEAVAAAHVNAPVHSLAGHALEYRQIIEGLRATIEDGARRHGLTLDVAELFAQLETQLARVAPLIERRRRQGKVKRGHGDLHLGNICLFEGAPMLFDALEFDERLATTDVLYDLAFLLMDLRCVALAAQANGAMNAYWDVADEDEAGLDLLPFFMSLRAAVRMAVAMEAGELEKAQTYRNLAFGLGAAVSPVLIAVGGLSGAGKSAVAQALAPMLPGPAGARLLRSDVLRKRELGLEMSARAGAGAYTPEQRDQVYRRLLAKAIDALAARTSAVADATFQASITREAIALAAYPGRFHGYWLSAPKEVRLARVAGRTNDASDADIHVAALQQEPERLPSGWRLLDADRPVAAIVQAICAELASG